MASKITFSRKIQIDNKWLLPMLHFLATLLFEKLTLIPNRASEVLFSMPLSDRFSVKFEQALCYSISKVMAAVIIFFLWKLVFWFLNKESDKETKIIFGTLFVISVASTILLWPGVFEAGGDNCIPFSYAIRLMPEYWHGIYLSCLYTASMMVFPHAISINVLQTVLFAVVLGYIYNRIKKSEALQSDKWVRFLVLPMIIFADSFTVATNPERAEYNASLTLLFVSIVLFDILEKRKRSSFELISLLVFVGFLSVFRSEGIIVSILGFIALLIFVYKPKLKDAAGLCIALLAVHFVLSLPAKVGNEKYYGSDYSIINSFNSLHNILCSDKSNITYEGVEKDLEAIEAITPLEVIKEFSGEGYRRLNFSKGYADINQSRAGKEASDAFLAAYKNLVIHNLPIYIKTQWHMFLGAIEVKNSTYIEEYNGEGTDLPMFDRTLWSVGDADLQVIPGRYTWERIEAKNSLAAMITIPRLKYIDFLKDSGIYTVLFVLELLASVVIIVFGIIKCFKKNFNEAGPATIALILDGYLLAMSLLMPVGANMYYHAYIYCMYVVILCCSAAFINWRKNGR